jgi:hypothetical protein
MARAQKVGEEDVTFGSHSIALMRSRIEANIFANEKSFHNLEISFSIKMAFNRNE